LSDGIRTAELQVIHDRLIALRDAGWIEIRFSAVHVIEITHLEAEAKPMALRRAQCIAALTAGRCFRAWIDQLPFEMGTALRGESAFPQVISDAGLWHADLSELAFSLRQSLVNEMKIMLRETGRSRHDRRTMAAAMMGHGHLKPAVLPLLHQGRDHLLEQMANTFPLSQRFFDEDLFLKYITGAVSAQTIVDEFSIIFRDVERFVGWTVDARDPQRKLISWLRTMGGRQVGDIQGLRERITALREKWPDLSTKPIFRDVDARMPELRNRRIRQVACEEKQILGDAEKRRQAAKTLCSLPWGSLPSIDVHISALAVHVKRQALMQRRMKESDAADILHMIHLPYCDLFRADGDAAQTARHAARPYGTEVIARLGDLVPAIERRLSQAA
jgi:hypothetical protein